jgi:acetate kinase
LRCLQEAGDERSRLALDMFVYRVRKYIGAYSAALNGRVDALIFSAGIGENSSIIRGMICEDFKVCSRLVGTAKSF